jgi:hypothetical protein
MMRSMALEYAGGCVSQVDERYAVNYSKDLLRLSVVTRKYCGRAAGPKVVVGAWRVLSGW